MKMKTKTLFQSTLSTLAVTLLVGCTERIEDSSSSAGGPITQAPCSETTKTFDSSGAIEPNLTLTALPAGVYRYENSEAYVETKVVSSGTTRTSRIHYLERKTSRDPAARTYEKGLRCREGAGSLTAFTMQLALPTDLKRFNNRLFDVVTRFYDISFRSATSSSLTVFAGGDMRSADPGVVASQLASTWNAGYHFARRSGEVYELHGLRLEADRTIYGKVVYTREALPANSL